MFYFWPALPFSRGQEPITPPRQEGRYSRLRAAFRGKRDACVSHIDDEGQANTLFSARPHDMRYMMRIFLLNIITIPSSALIILLKITRPLLLRAPVSGAGFGLCLPCRHRNARKPSPALLHFSVPARHHARPKPYFARHARVAFDLRHGAHSPIRDVRCTGP